MRILHVYKTYYPDSVGGIEQVLFQLTRSLSALGVENRIFTLSPGGQRPLIQRREAQVHRCRTTVDVASNGMSLQALVEFRRQLAWADVVHYQFPWPFADLLHLLWGSGKPSVVSYQSDVVRQKRLMRLYSPLMRRFLARVDRVVATSPPYLRSSAVLRSLPRSCEVIPNGLDPASYPAPGAARLQHWRDAVGEGFFLFVGVLRYYKGLDTLLDAAAGVLAGIVIAGDGPQAPRLAARVQSEGLANVRLLGHVDDEDKVALMALARGFVFPSCVRSEAFGMSLAEAAMWGLPLVSCEIGTGTSYINEHGVTGWTVPPGDAAALGRAMRRLQADPAEAARQGAAARQRFQRLFTAQAMAQAYLRLYQGLLASRQPRGASASIGPGLDAGAGPGGS